MNSRFTRAIMPIALWMSGFALPSFAAGPLPVRGLNLMAPKAADVPLLARFIRDALPKEGVNVLVLEINYRYRYTSHPEVVDDDPLTKDDIKSIVAASKAAGVRLIPLINLLGHQSWAGTTFGLLRSHPEFDETPGKYPGNKDIYCRSYCPLHPGVHKIVIDLMDELADACEADAVHVGMDEVFILGDPDCPRCKTRSKAELFAQEVRTLHDHLRSKNREMWMWGDRFLDGTVTGLGKWEASEDGTAWAMHMVPRGIVICDWHYDSVSPTAAHFAIEGFRVVSAPWRKTSVALGQLDLIRSVHANADSTIAPRMLGMLQTTWVPAGDFIRAYYGEASTPPPGIEATEAAATFKTLCKAIQHMP